LGRGGFGITYLAEDIDKLNERCVVKQLIHQGQGSQPTQKVVQLFEREAKQLQLLGEHPQIPALFAYFQEEGYLYLVQQFVDGQNLLTELNQHGSFRESQIRELLLNLLPTLQYIHERGVIHRDLKPENMMRRRSDGNFVLIDFGISKQLTHSLVTLAGTIAGSLGYASPEQMEDGQATPANDLYSLGVSCFHLLTGIHPWSLWKDEGYGWLRRWQQHLSQPLSLEVAQVLNQLLQREAAQRYQTADAVLRDLQSQRPISAASSTPLPQTPIQTTIPVRRSHPSPSASESPHLPRLTRRMLVFSGMGLLGVLAWEGVKQLLAALTLSQNPLVSKPSANPNPISPEVTAFPVAGSGGNRIKVGILHSLNGTMAISEKSAVDAELLAIEEINKAGGVLGKQIEAIVEDGNSDWPTFNEKAKKLIDQDQVVTVFGCWTSASRIAVRSVFESKNHLLWYPVQYEGQECSKNIFYTGAVPNQQVEPSVTWLLQRFKGWPFFLVGSDYVFPRTVNTVIKAQLRVTGGQVAGEEYIPLGSLDVAPLITKIKSVMPNRGIVYNTLNGDSNVAFFKQLQQASLNSSRYPSMSVGITEEEVQAIGVKYLRGHYAAWNYFQTVETPDNQKFVAAFKAKYGADRLVNDPMEAAYIMVYLWKQAVEKAGNTDDLEAVRQAAYGQTFDAPEGLVTLNSNHHLSKFVRIGQVRADGLFKIVYETKAAVKPVPWNQLIQGTKGLACDWSNPAKGGKYKI
jgi:urea transport system substrate-binding protein